VAQSARLSPTVQRLAALQAMADARAQPVQREDDDPVYQWRIYNSARKHYDDGWGALYGITRDAQLKAVVAEGSDAEGNQSIELGRFAHPDEYMRRLCTVAYENVWNGNVCETIVFHCGPNNG
jgi:hypothetical protein